MFYPASIIHLSPFLFGVLDVPFNVGPYMIATYMNRYRRL